MIKKDSPGLRFDNLAKGTEKNETEATVSLHIVFACQKNADYDLKLTRNTMWYLNP